MLDIGPEKLIKAVKSRPVIYNKNHKMYCHKNYKEKIWREICAELHWNWNHLSPLDKILFVREIQKRWKNLRTCFSRELCMQKKEQQKREAKEHVKRRKPYEYFHLMSFILEIGDNEEGRDSDDSTDPLDDIHEPEEMICDFTESSNDVNNVNVKVENLSEESYQEPQQIVYERNNTLEEKLIDRLRDIKKDEADADRQFLLSLVPSFRKLNDEQKITAKIEMLKVLQSITFQQNETIG